MDVDKKEQSKKVEEPADRLIASRFRFLNEQLYTQPAREAQEIFKDGEEAFKVKIHECKYNILAF
jgi:hypothetical protein